MRHFSNLFDGLPTDVPEELVQTLLTTGRVRIERIVSHGHASAAGFWYDQADHEWVLLVAGAARLRFEGDEPFDMMPGSYVNIPAHRRHRVEWTDLDRPTIWLAIHYA
ncbi:MAG TPA: cupin domain-containing protein [Tepidisphaeraceae bacterium]|jgi:cupin 2 domain-containing protein